MIIMRSVVAYDKKTVNSTSITHNLVDIPGWLLGTSLSLSKWNVRLNTVTTPVNINDQDYPIRIHHTFSPANRITDIHLYRMAGGHELYINLVMPDKTCTLFDMKVEFVERADE